METSLTRCVYLPACVCPSSRSTTVKALAEGLTSCLTNVNIASKRACGVTLTEGGTGSPLESILNVTCTSYAAKALHEQIHHGLNSYYRPVLQDIGAGPEVEDGPQEVGRRVGDRVLWDCRVL